MDKFKESNTKIDKVVGYNISEKQLQKEVTTPGGGGDKVKYRPYKDIESVLYTVLSNKFKDVYSVRDTQNAKFIKEKKISLIFTPILKTDSSSGSLVTWPPTKFNIVLAIQAIDNSGIKVWEKELVSEGNAEYDEFKSDFSLSARRATESVFLKLVEELDKIKLEN